ncbi:hypothetical protein [Oceanobacillus chungangensis]|uniref:hypothetical protein n=1 Tax=Oceanobacillus chungangensis TaxID=1229152 RepID=UPI0011C07ACA|nr:hypothetical protein [Oceanobacillus chungangensis]
MSRMPVDSLKTIVYWPVATKIHFAFRGRLVSLPSAGVYVYFLGWNGAIYHLFTDLTTPVLKAFLVLRKYQLTGLYF